MTYYVTADSFGSEIPSNWEEIAAFLNSLTDERGIAEDHDACNELWEAYWAGELDGAPEAQTGYTFYAVQIGSNFDWDNGSTDWDEAVRMAEAAAADDYNDGDEIRIATIEHAGTDDAYCTEEHIHRAGNR